MWLKTAFYSNKDFCILGRASTHTFFPKKREHYHISHEEKRMVKIIEQKAVENKICPSCEHVVDFVWICQYESFELIEYVYLCNHCSSILRITEQKDTPPF